MMRTYDPQPLPREARPPIIAVVIPCYKVRRHISGVIQDLGPIVDQIYCVDDACPEKSADFIEAEISDPRVTVVRHPVNLGVGGATLTGYRAALENGADIIIKVDGDGQMDTALLPLFIEPLADGRADYVKGNRFDGYDATRQMPALRLFGNAALSFMTKASSGYWNVFDPTNGYTAIHALMAARIVKRRVAERYFFESDMLFHLYLERAVVVDTPIPARYGDEVSNLHISRIIGPFLYRNVRNGMTRIVVRHFLQDFSLASIEAVIGILAIMFGGVFGAIKWMESLQSGVAASPGSVMLAAMPILVGVQLLLSSLNYDMTCVPRLPRHRALRMLDALTGTQGRKSHQSSLDTGAKAQPISEIGQVP